ncbi:hypothetical protein FQR65_LT01597 [Abscondita terminalis]|nr:hypothetical protein FQR65_LT01597 [Abscondita terminalis]
MAKKNKSKKCTPTEQENTILPNPVEVDKADSQQNDVASSSSTQETRRQKKNRKLQEKKKSDGGQPQQTTIESSSSKTDIIQKDEEKSSCVGENDSDSSWKNVEHSSRKLKNVNKVTEVVDEVNPYKQPKKDIKSLSTKNDKRGYDNAPVKNNDRKSKDFESPFKQHKKDAKTDKGAYDYFNNIPVKNDDKKSHDLESPYKQQKKDTKPLSVKNNKDGYDYFNNEPVNDFKSNDRKPKDFGKSRREGSDGKHLLFLMYRQEEDTPRGSITKQFKCPVRNVRYPLVDIEGGTAIIYFGTVNGHVSEDMESLDNKFRIIGEYKRANRKLGDVIQAYKSQQEYSLLGCITRNTEKDPFDFVSFQKCIAQIKKLNKSYYAYVGIQAFLDDDDLLLNKITTMLRYSLVKVDVYVCWGGNMLNFMPPDRGGDYF